MADPETRAGPMWPATGIYRRVQAGWVWTVAAAIGLAFIGMTSLMRPGTPMPRLVWDLYRMGGFTFADIQALNGLLGAAFVLIYLGLPADSDSAWPGWAHPARGAGVAPLRRRVLHQRDLFTLLGGDERWAILAGGGSSRRRQRTSIHAVQLSRTAHQQPPTPLALEALFSPRSGLV